MKVLIVDDTQSVLLTTAAMVKKAGHAVVTAQDGTAAQAAFQQERPDLVLLDVVMPEPDGYAVATELRQLCGDEWVPIIFLSGLVSEDDIAKGIEAGGDDYLTKPVSSIVLRAKLHAMQRIADMRARLVSTTAKLEAANSELRSLHTRDGLTGVANRRYFEAEIKREWERARRNSASLALLFVDIDDFRDYNEHYGPLLGDKCLARIAQVVAASARRAADMVARYSGNRFAIALPDTDAEGAAQVADKLRVAVERLEIKHPLGRVAPFVTVSIGCAAGIPTGKAASTQLVEAAEQALVLAKRADKNRVISADQGRIAA
jgi:diguanylate cyclase (GGDEF)-like protein